MINKAAKYVYRIVSIQRCIFAVALFSLWFNYQPVPCTAAEQSAASLSKLEIVNLGEKMYRDGILPSGKIMAAFIRGDVELNSTAFACSSCHLRSGFGSVEGSLVTPPANGATLFKPYQQPPAPADIQNRDKREAHDKPVIKRRAYTRESLAIALRSGTDPEGRVLNDVMPRYPLADNDMSVLISYLETLSTTPSPGANSNEIRFATIISDDVSQEDRKALLLPLQSFIAHKKQQFELYNEFIKFGYTPTVDMKYAFRQATLDIWELKGAPETWQGQLAAYHRKKPVFAVLGGISNKDWLPVHTFCETERLPCLFPITDFPVLSETTWYTYYFSKGYPQEGEAVARYLNKLETLNSTSHILQLVQDSPSAKALAAGFDTAWRELEHPPVTTLTLTSKQLRNQSDLDKLLGKHKPQVLLLWTDGELLPDLAATIARLTPPSMVFVSSTMLGKKTAAIPEKVRDRTFISYPYRLTPYVGPKTGGLDARVPILASAKDFGDRRIASRTASILNQAILNGLSQLNDNLYQDYLLDTMSMQMDLIVRDYEQLTFGPGQRYVSRGCYIIQLGPGSDPPLLQRSDWVIH